VERETRLKVNVELLPQGYLGITALEGPDARRLVCRAERVLLSCAVSSRCGSATGVLAAVWGALPTEGITNETRQGLAFGRVWPNDLTAQILASHPPTQALRWNGQDYIRIDAELEGCPASPAG